VFRATPLRNLSGDAFVNMIDILGQAGGIGAMARELGIDESTAQSGVAALLPAVLGGFKGQAETQPEGLGGIVSMIGGMGGGGLLASVLGSQPSNVDAGNSVLGAIFGSKDVSRTVADHASNQSGLSSDLLKKMLPLIAMAVAGYMAHHASAPAAAATPDASGGGLGGMLGNLLGGVMGGGQSATPAPAPGLGGLGSLLGMGQSGNALNDILGMAGRMMGR
jgi:hypothetical protein